MIVARGCRFFTRSSLISSAMQSVLFACVDRFLLSIVTLVVTSIAFGFVGKSAYSVRYGMSVSKGTLSCKTFCAARIQLAAHESNVATQSDLMAGVAFSPVAC